MTASLLMDLTYLTSIHEETGVKLSARRHEKKHRNVASTDHEPTCAEDKAESEQTELAAASSAAASAASSSDLRVSHSLDEVKVHAASNSKSESEISSVAGGASESLFLSAPHNTAGEGVRKKGHEHGPRSSHDLSSITAQSEMNAVQLSYLYLGAMKTLSALLSCSKYAELLLIPKVLTHQQCILGS